jgi:hypothetical protein
MQTTRGGRKLKEWLKDRGKNQQWFAEELSRERGERVYQSSVSAWARGASLIPLWGGLAIQKLTGIPAADWTIPEDDSGPSLAKRTNGSRHRHAG